MASAGNGVVVWEFNENGRWIPYDPSVTQFIEKHYVNINKTACSGMNGHGVGASAVHGLSSVSASLPPAPVPPVRLSLGEVDSTLNDYYIDLITNEQIEYTPGRSMPMRVPVRRSNYPEDCLLNRGVLWQWRMHHMWKAYDMETAMILEKEYNRHPKTVVDLSHTACGLPYYVDFIHMEQTNIVTKFPRHVQRNIVSPYPKDCSSGKISKTKASSTVASSAPNSVAERKSLVDQTSSSMRTRSTKYRAAASNSIGGVGGHTKHAAASAHGPSKRKKKSHSATQEMLQGSHIPTTLNDCDIHEILGKYSRVVEKIPHDEECCICCEKLSTASGYIESDHSPTVIELNKCKHMFHQACLYAMYKTGVKDCSMQCPICKTIYGQKMGCCPDGEMNTHKMRQSLPGHPDCHTIVIEYAFRPGIQDSRHPNPGCRYYTNGFPRHCFLPDNKDGKKILKLLKKAWDRKLTFTIGTSVTTGHPDTVVWNEIHHKTEFGSNVTGHGYPDPNYVANVLAELAAQGITEDSEDEERVVNVLTR